MNELIRFKVGSSLLNVADIIINTSFYFNIRGSISNTWGKIDFECIDKSIH